MRRIGVLMSTAADDPEGQARIAAFHQGLQQLGWSGLMAQCLPFIVAELGRDADPFMLHLYAALAERERMPSPPVFSPSACHRRPVPVAHRRRPHQRATTAWGFQL